LPTLVETLTTEVCVLEAAVETVDKFESVVDSELETFVRLVETPPRLVETLPRLLLIAT